MAQAEKEEGPDTRHSASSYLRTKHRNHAEKNKRKCKREGREKRERVRVLCRHSGARAPSPIIPHCPAQAGLHFGVGKQRSRNVGVTARHKRKDSQLIVTFMTWVFTFPEKSPVFGPGWPSSGHTSGTFLQRD